MKVIQVILLAVSLLSLTVATEVPQGSQYVGGFLCPPPQPTEASDAVPDCSTNCSIADGCVGDGMRCCPTTPGCRDCIEAVATDASRCEDEDGVGVAPLAITLEDCELCICVAGVIYCHEMEGDCENATVPSPGGSCSYGDRDIPPGELTRIVSDDEDENECTVCFCGNGVLFCHNTTECGPAVVCEYGEQQLVVGDSVPADDGCNTCVCTAAGDVACTEIACPVDVCDLPMVVGPCDAAIPSWFYNSESGECEIFTYGGCGGNDNRFDTRQACEAQCDDDVCDLPMDMGVCLAYFPSWFHNSTSGECEMFTYGGCGGNGNRFQTLKACQARCDDDAVDVCDLPMVVGPCEALISSWFYNSESGECEMFNYGGCQGNDNRFVTRQACEARCDDDGCPDGVPQVSCFIDPCEVSECDEEGAECVANYCGGCHAVWMVDDREVCQAGCPEGVPPVLCFANPCEVSECDEEGAECIANYCGGCHAVWMVDDREVCQAGRDCPDGVDEVQCLIAPCEEASCPAIPTARCVDDYCGGCRARFYTHDGEVTDDCRQDCEDGEDIVFCFRRPCEDAVCPDIPEATCTDDYCGGCHARWVRDGEDVTDRCSESSGGFEVNHFPTCPAVEVDTCAEECSGDDACEESQLCCRGCGSSCRTAVSLPYYDVPFVCPPQILSLSSDSATCDLECQSDAQCPGSKICCRSGCSSSCQAGQSPPAACNVVRELLETLNRRDDADDDDDTDENGEENDRPLLGQYVPACMDEGFFNPVQVWENHLWCVNVVTGQPVSSAYQANNNLSFSCPNCTHNGRVFYAGQTFYDDCNICTCSGNGLSLCTRRACLDPCSLPAEAGMCEDRVTQYFFNSESRQCEEFVYSGCGGNANRFSSSVDCLHACRPDSVCLLDRDDGETCHEGQPQNVYFYYNTDESECQTMVANQCGGNANRFSSGPECLRICDPSGTGPTDAHGNRCWLIQCDIPICGGGTEIVYSDDSCCPYCRPVDAVECEDDQFTCLDGLCIPTSQVCDRLRDCSDGSDEAGEECDIDIVPCEFRCSDEQCIPHYVCDRVLDCDNALDEHDCVDEFVPGAPFYPPPLECPDFSDILGACDVGECVTDAECEGRGMCCPNNCNQRMCVPPIAVSPACEAVVAQLTPNASYIPQCLSSGDYRPLQCSGDTGERLCWCANTRTGIPYTSTFNDHFPDCERCIYGGSMYAPGQSYTAEDGCNTCLCISTGESVCTRTACVPTECQVGDIATIGHGETKDLDCLSCSCMYGELTCSRRVCAVTDRQMGSFRVEMTFDGDFTELTAGGMEDELAREVRRTLLRRYQLSMDLQEDQIVIIELREGSVIVVVELTDTSDETGANITILVYQLEQDYNAGTLVIRFNNAALVPSGDFQVDPVSQEEDGFEFVWWYGLIIGVVVLVAALVFLVILLLVCCRGRHSKIQSGKMDNIYTGGVEMEKVPLDEKA